MTVPVNGSATDDTGYVYGYVDGTLYLDNDGDGSYTSGTDTPLSGVTVVITDSAGTVYTTTTNSSGYFTQTVVPGATVVDVEDGDLPPDVSLTTGSTDPTTVTVPVNGSATDDTGYVQQTDVTISKGDAPDPVVAGNVLTYTLAYGNISSVDAENVAITDTLPVSVTFGGGVSETPAISGPTQNGQQLTWTVPVLTAGSSGQIVYTVTVAAGMSGTLVNSVVITTTTPDLDPDNNSDDEPTTVTLVTTPGVSVSKTRVSASPAIVGESVTYEIVVLNTGDTVLSTVPVTDTYDPVYQTYAAATPVPDSVSSGMLTWNNVGPLAVGERVTLTVQFTATTVTASTTNRAAASGTDEYGDDVPEDSDTATVTIIAVPVPGLTVVKTAYPAAVQAGEFVTYTLAWSVSGSGTAQNVTLRDVTPAHTVFWAATPAATSDPGQGGTGPVVWNLGNRVAPASGVVTMVVRANVGVPSSGVIVNTASITDSTGLTATGTVTTPVLVPGLELVKTVDPPVAVPNTPITYVITLTNTGQVPFDTLGLVLTDTLPQGFNYVPGSSSPSEPTVVAEPLLRWNNLGTLGVGDHLQVRFAVTTTSAITLGIHTNRAVVSAEYSGGVITDTDEVSVVIEDPQVEVDKSVAELDRDNLTVTFTIAITNTGVSVLDFLPMTDLYDPTVLEFTHAVPSPQEPESDGALSWYDLTGPAPYGFGQDLLPGQTFVITTTFNIIRDIDVTTNTVVVDDGSDVHGNTLPRNGDDVQLIDVPTAIDLMYLRAVRQENAIAVEWKTALEIENFGFRLLRATEPDLTRASEIAFVPSACRGNLCGSEYVYIDQDAVPGVQYWYWLVDVDLHGFETIHTPVTTAADIFSLPIRLYIPLVMR